VFNDVYKQEWLWDRQKFYEEMTKLQVPSPRHFFVTRDTNENLREIYKKYYSNKKEIIE